MTSYADFAEFRKRVGWSNTHFEKWKRSSLHDLIEVLKSHNGSSLKVQTELHKIPVAKIQKYRDAMYYLVTTYPSIVYSNVQWGLSDKAKATTFPQTQLPVTYNPYDPSDKANAIVKGSPPTAYQYDSVEHFLLTSTDTNGVILIHLDDEVDELDNVYDGRAGVDHINSVLRVAKLVNAQVCSLHFKPNDPVCHRLKAAYNDLSNPVAVHEAQGQHMGNKHLAFRLFVASKTNCVVMGYDGAVCVHANIFGTAEPPKSSASDMPTPVAPLITTTNVVTSRAVLMSNGTLSPFAGDGTQYGVLHNT